MVGTGDFARIVGEANPRTVSAYLSRHGAPWPSDGSEFLPERARRYGFREALAWTLARDLCALGMTWPAACTILANHDVARQELALGNCGAGRFFAVSHGGMVPAEGVAAEIWPNGWSGTASKIAESIDHDATKNVNGRTQVFVVSAVRMVSIEKGIATARDLARRAGWDVTDEWDFVPIETVKGTEE
jgi:hypothetical protein